MLRPGDIVFARTGATTGKSYMIRELPEPTVFASYLIRVRVASSVDSSYLAHFFETPAYWRQITTSANGAAQPGVNATKLGQLRIPLPPLEEQRRIAAVLDNAGDLRKKRETTLDLLDALVGSIFRQMLGRNTPDAQGTVDLAEVCDVLAGFAFDSGRFSDHGDLPVVRIRDVVRGVSNTYYVGPFDKRYVVSDGDILVGMDGEFNRGRWRGGPALLNQRVCRIAVRDPRVSEALIFAFLPSQLKAIEDRTPFATVKHLSMKDLRGIQIPLVPESVQRRFEQQVHAVGDLRSAAVAANEHSAGLFASLQHRAFAGQL